MTTFVQFVDNLAKETVDRLELIAMAKLREVMLEWAAAIRLKEGMKAIINLKFLQVAAIGLKFL